MLKREEIIGLLIGMLITMIVVALTLPTEESLEINRKCFEECKMLIVEEEKKSFWSEASYFSRLEDCIEACTEEKNENSD